MKPARYSFPSIRALVSALVAQQASLRKHCSVEDCTDPHERDATPGTDLRLQVKEGAWYIHTGPSDYDQDHRGVWGASFLPYGRANLRAIACDLIDQAREQAAYETDAA